MDNNENKENLMNGEMANSSPETSSVENSNTNNQNLEMPAPATNPDVNQVANDMPSPIAEAPNVNPAPVEAPMANNTNEFSQPIPTENNQNVNAVPVQNEVPNNQQIINTEAVKAQANKIFDGVKNVGNEINEKVKTDKRVLYILVAGAAVVFIIGLMLVTNILFNPAKSTVKTYLNAMKNYDAKKIVNCYHPKMVEAMEEYLSDEDLVEYYEDLFDDREDDDYKILSYEIDNDYKKYDKDDLEDFAEDLEDSYDINEKDVKEVRRYSVKLKVDDDGDKDTEKQKIVVAKIKGKWYIFS